MAARTQPGKGRRSLRSNETTATRVCPRGRPPHLPRPQFPTPYLAFAQNAEAGEVVASPCLRKAQTSKNGAAPRNERALLRGGRAPPAQPTGNQRAEQIAQKTRTRSRQNPARGGETAPNPPLTLLVMAGSNFTPFPLRLSETIA